MAKAGASSGGHRKRGGSRLERLAAEVEALRTEVSALRVELASEVRTRRIVLVEEDGFERLVLATDGRFGRVALYGRAVQGGATCVEMFANDPIDGHGAHVGVALTDREEVVAVLEVLERGRPILWFGGGAASETSED